VQWGISVVAWSGIFCGMGGKIGLVFISLRATLFYPQTADISGQESLDKVVRSIGDKLLRRYDRMVDVDAGALQIHDYHQRITMDSDISERRAAKRKGWSADKKRQRHRQRDRDRKSGGKSSDDPHGDDRDRGDEERSDSDRPDRSHSRHRRHHH